MSGIAAQELADLVMRWIYAWGFRPRLTQPRSLLRILPKNDRGLRFDSNPYAQVAQRDARKETVDTIGRGQAGSEASTNQ